MRQKVLKKIDGNINIYQLQKILIITLRNFIGLLKTKLS